MSFLDSIAKIASPIVDIVKNASGDDSSNSAPSGSIMGNPAAGQPIGDTASLGSQDLTSAQQDANNQLDSLVNGGQPWISLKLIIIKV